MQVWILQGYEEVDSRVKERHAAFECILLRCAVCMKE